MDFNEMNSFYFCPNFRFSQINYKERKKICNQNHVSWRGTTKTVFYDDGKLIVMRWLAEAIKSKCDWA